MYRTLTSIALMAMLFLTGCGGSGSKESENTGGNKSAGASKPSTLPAEQQAEVGLEVNIGQLMTDEATKAMLESNPELPPFVMKMTNMSAYVALPANMGLASDPSNFDFFASLEFGDAESCKAAFDQMMSAAPAEDVEKNGKSFKKIAAPGSPVVYILMEGSSIKAYSENYVNSDATSYASEGLRTALSSAPSNEPFKMAVDIEGANDFLAAAGGMVPQLESVVNSKSLVMAGGGKDDLLFMMAVVAPDEETAKKVKSSMSAGVALLAMGAASQMPSPEVAPVTSEFVQYVMKNLTPKVEGNTVKVVINKPENYEDMKKKLPEEMKKIQEEMMKKQFGGPGGPGVDAGKGPIKEIEKK